MAPQPELSTRSLAAPSNPGCQPEIVPSSVTKMNRSPANEFASPLKTCPVGADGGVPFLAVGMVTVRSRLPFESYTVVSPVPLSETHAGPIGLKESPHALTRLG